MTFFNTLFQDGYDAALHMTYSIDKEEEQLELTIKIVEELNTLEIKKILKRMIKKLHSINSRYKKDKRMEV